MRWWVTAIFVWFILQGTACAEDNFLDDVYKTQRPVNIIFPLKEVYWKDLNAQDHIIYRGFYETAVSKLNSYVDRWQNQAIQDYWDKSSIAFLEYDSFLNRHNEKMIDYSTGMWWTRSWQESLLPQTGGYLSHTYYYGQEYKILEIGGIELNNTGHIKIGDLGLLLFNREDNTNTALQTKSIMYRDELSTIPPSLTTLSNDIKTKTNFNLKMLLPKASLIKNNYYEISQQFNIGLRGSINVRKILNKIELKTKIKIYSSLRTGEPICQIGINTQGSPIDKTFECSFTAEFIIW